MTIGGGWWTRRDGAHPGRCPFSATSAPAACWPTTIAPRKLHERKSTMGTKRRGRAECVRGTEPGNRFCVLPRRIEPTEEAATLVPDFQRIDPEASYTLAEARRLKGVPDAT